MSLLNRLFASRRPLRHFALLDNQGHCRALRQCQDCPSNGNWVEVHESRLAWLGAALPVSARLTPVVAHARQARPLAA